MTKTSTITPNGYAQVHFSRHHNHIAYKDGKVYIFDNSGRDPDETDDGPLWIPEDKLTEIHVRLDSDSPYGPKAKIPVRTGGEGEYWTEVDLEGALIIGRRLSIPVLSVASLYEPKFPERIHYS
jgi:hypothetical protein